MRVVFFAAVALAFVGAAQAAQTSEMEKKIESLELENKRLELHQRLMALEEENRRLRDQVSNPEYVGHPEEPKETSMLEVSEGEDPLVECQTVCKFVRPNQMTVVEQAALQQQQQEAKAEAEKTEEKQREEAEEGEAEEEVAPEEEQEQE